MPIEIKELYMKTTIQMTYKYQPQDRWQPLVASMCQMGDMRRVDRWIELCEYSTTKNCFVFASTLIFVRPMLLIFLVFCVVFVLNIFYSQLNE